MENRDVSPVLYDLVVDVVCAQHIEIPWRPPHYTLHKRTEIRRSRRQISAASPGDSDHLFDGTHAQFTLMAVNDRVNSIIHISNVAASTPRMWYIANQRMITAGDRDRARCCSGGFAGFPVRCWNSPACAGFVAHLDREWPALRPLVVNRKISGGHRTWRGAWTQHVLATVIGTNVQGAPARCGSSAT